MPWGTHHVRAARDHSVTARGARDHGWGLPSVRHDVWDPEDGAEDRAGRTSTPRGARRTKYFPWWSSVGRERPQSFLSPPVSVKVQVTWFGATLKQTLRQGFGGETSGRDGSDPSVGRRRTEKEGNPKRVCQ